MSDETVDGTPLLVEAISTAYTNVTGTFAGQTSVQHDAALDAQAKTNSAVAAAASTAHSNYAKAGHDLQVTFSDVEQMSTSLSSLNRFVGPIVASTASVAGAPDLVASLLLSPLTGAAAESAATTAAAQLAIKLATAEALTLVTASVVTTYQLADSALSGTATSLHLGAGVSVAIWSQTSTMVGVSVRGSIAETSAVLTGLWTTGTAIIETARAINDLAVLSGVIGAVGAASIVDGFLRQPLDVNAFSLSGVWTTATEDMQGALGATGPFYDDILSQLIRDGHTLGFFADGDAHLGKPGHSQDWLDATNLNTAKASASAVLGGAGHFASDDDFRVLPRDLPSLFAGSAQIDAVGGDRLADIRIIDTASADGRATYIVQIPSTQSWDPRAGSTPNDLTSDIYAMRYGSQSALARSVFDAMSAHGIPTGTGPNAPHIMVTGFSLGGITAGAIAADSHGYNIENVVTAGSPIGSMNIPASVHVAALEAKEDAVPTLDGRPNPSSWTTVRQDAYPLLTEHPSSVMSPGNSHDANRYAMMASKNSNTLASSSLDKYFEGPQTIHDYYSSR